MAHSDISDALSARLNTLSNAPAIVWENTSYTPTEGTEHIAEFYIPADQTEVGIANTDSIDYTGIYQVDVVMPVGESKNDGNELADRIMSHFKRGTVMTSNGQTVFVESVTRNQGLRDNAWWRISVSVNWRSFGGNI